MTNIALNPSTTFNQLLGDLEIALTEEAQRRSNLAHARETQVLREAKASLEEREDARRRDESSKTSKRTTEAEIEALVRTNAVVLDAQEMVREAQLRYDLAKMLSEIARYRVQFALSATRYSSGVVD